jgi:methyl-accepting chemotaxis protein
MGLFGSSVLFLLGFIYWSTAAYMAHQADETIQAEIAGLAERYRSDGLTGLSSVLAQRATSRVGGNALYLLTDEFGTPLVGNLDRWPPVTPEPNGWLNFSLEHAGPRDEIHPARAQPFVLEGGYRLLVGLDMQGLQQTERRIITALIWGLAITLLLALAGGTLMSRSMGRIMHGDLSRRIPTEDSDDDFDRLAANLNRMLDRIQALMEDVRRVSDNIAHDLKTPLTRLRNSLELLGASQEDPEERQQLVEGAPSMHCCA